MYWLSNTVRRLYSPDNRTKVWCHLGLNIDRVVCRRVEALTMSYHLGSYPPSLNMAWAAVRVVRVATSKLAYSTPEEF